MQELKFNEHNFALIERDGKTWLTAADIATALGYKRSDQVSRIFERHEREFSTSMTMVFQAVSLGRSLPPSDIRLFSLRGAHLVGMFSRTEKGQAFRAWVLDQLDEIDRQAAPNRSLMAAWFKAKAAVDAQDKFASLCGKGLSEHKQIKPPLKKALDQISDQIQPSLLT
ncbi:MAG: BRO family protein [Pseudomonadota bacterium]